MIRSIVILLVLFFSFLSSVSWAEKAEIRTCLGETFFPKRTGRVNCWIRFESQSENGIKVWNCVPKELWQTWLDSKETRFCGTFYGNWRLRSYSVDENSLYEKKENVAIFRIQRADLSPPSIKDRESTGRWIYKKIERLREFLSSEIHALDELGILRKLVLNEDLPGNSFGIFRILGFVHLLSVTGIHLYSLAELIYGATFSISSKLGLPVRISLAMARILSIFIWLFSWVMNGMRPGMLRPISVVCFRAVGRYLGLKWRLFTPLVLTIAIDLGVAWFQYQSGNPHPWAPGRTHYLLAVSGGLLCVHIFKGKKQGNKRGFLESLKAHLGLSVGSWLTTAIYDALSSQFVALGTPLVSLLTIPVFTYLIYPSILVLCFIKSIGLPVEMEGISDLVLFFSSSFLVLILKALLYFKTFWMIPKIFLIVGMVLSSLFFTKTSFQKLILGILPLLCIFRLSYEIKEEFNFKRNFQNPMSATSVEQLDVGQGDSALVRVEEGYGLIDVGSFRGLSLLRWLELFLDRRISSLHWIVLTHLDEDHRGSLPKILSLISVERVGVSNLQLRSKSGSLFVDQLNQLGSQHLLFDLNTEPFDFFTKTISTEGKSSNSNSSNSIMNIFLVPFTRGGFYLNLGDLSQKGENMALDWISSHTVRFKKGPRILKVSHHGSRYSTSDKLLNRLRFTDAWISSGVSNYYGHPTVEVLKKLERNQLKVWRTDLCGNLKFPIFKNYSQCQN